MRVLITPDQIQARQSDLRMRFLGVMRQNPISAYRMQKEIGISRETIKNFLLEKGQLRADILYKILNYIEKWEHAELHNTEIDYYESKY